MADHEEDKGGGLFFLDSGAFSLHMKHSAGERGFSFYDTNEFWDYVDAYARFVKKHEDVIDYYANVDVMFEPKRSWKVLKYLEDEHGLRPVPVVHYGTDESWLRKYVDDGYEFIGLGGLAAGGSTPPVKEWIDRMFTALCPKSNGRLPIVRTHGFAMTAYTLLIRYPWWSVDSATWTKVGAFGSILVPHKRRGKFDFAEDPYMVGMSKDSPSVKAGDAKHYKAMPKEVQEIVFEWLDHIGVPLGKVSKDGEVIEEGVITRHTERKVANLLFFEALRKWLPEYPWAFAPETRITVRKMEL